MIVSRTTPADRLKAAGYRSGQTAAQPRCAGCVNVDPMFTRKQHGRRCLLWSAEVKTHGHCTAFACFPLSGAATKP